jgi:hypothetical protein
MHARRAREAGPQVDELADARVCEHAHGADRECPVRPGQPTLVRRNGQDLVGRRPVYLVVVLAAQILIIL